MLIDAHVHLDKYETDLKQALQEIRSHDIFTIAVAMDVPSYRRCREIGDECGRVLPTFGIHPRRAPEYVDRLSELSPLVEQSLAIGEIGLDFHWVKDSSQYPAQLKVLEYFLAAAHEQNKMVNLHTKGAERKILDLLERYDIQRAIVHWYSGPMDIFHALVQFGAYLHRRRRSLLFRDHTGDCPRDPGSSTAHRDRQPRRSQMAQRLHRHA